MTDYNGWALRINAKLHSTFSSNPFSFPLSLLPNLFLKPRFTFYNVGFLLAISFGLSFYCNEWNLVFIGVQRCLPQDAYSLTNLGFTQGCISGPYCLLINGWGSKIWIPSLQRSKFARGMLHFWGPEIMPIKLCYLSIYVNVIQY